MAVALALPVIAAVLLPVGIAGCHDDRHGHDRVIVVPEGRGYDQDRHHEASSDEHRDRREH